MHQEVNITLGNESLKIETGVLAKQADGAVLVTAGETVVLVTACAAKEQREGLDFFPLTCEYKEKSYAAGKIPGGFFKREGRPAEQEILMCRMMDRPIRPLFPKEFKNETQVLATVLSYDGVNSPDTLAIIGASSALHISSIPLLHPVGAVRVAYMNNEFILNPSKEQKSESPLDLLVVGTHEGIVMVEAGAQELEESIIIDALLFAHEAIKKIVDSIEDLRSRCGKEKMTVEEYSYDENFTATIKADISDDLRAALLVKGKFEQSAAIKAVKNAAKEKFVTEETDDKNASDFSAIFGSIESDIIRNMILNEGTRTDGRALNEIRDISIQLGVLPKVHGSAVFTRGETQALAVLTLGVGQDEQMQDNLDGKGTKKFLLHYNFPPFCVGEVGKVGFTGRREIGHGALAERAVKAILPDHGNFPYTIRLVSEVLESNGSSSMATVCGSSLALMEGGVAIKGHVAGIAMGLISEGDKAAVLSDILGIEDHEGDMDFKVCGTRKGITALQMDIKITSVSRELLEKALNQAKEGRLHILSKMEEVITDASTDVHKDAPRITTLTVPKDKIRDIIGSGGKTIREIQETCGVTIEINDDGVVNIASSDSVGTEKAVQIVKDLTKSPEVGETYNGIVKKIVDFGAFVEIFKGTEGLLHISEISHQRTEKVSDVLKEGDTVMVKLLGFDRGKLKLSKKALEARE
ncbi:MAG: polyribonucleotide nucleotidyltransferase [Nitrospinae bacterium]|nr:polyribonucleotide nucleotidyltransferase [Nitrospinota bacterium]